MPWYLVPYKRYPAGRYPWPYARYCAMDDFTAQILADVATWKETEVLRNVAIAKVSSAVSASTLTLLDAALGFTRILVARLQDPLGSQFASRQLNFNGVGV